MDKRSSRGAAGLIEHTLTGNIEISPGVHLISIFRDVDFLPGQVIKIAVDLEHPPRIYSICSGIHESEICILFSIKEDGFLTPKLASYIPGDKIFVSAPFGSFTDGPEPAWWIAAGTGIAPFFSMFKSGLFENKTLIHGVRHLNQFYFEDELSLTLGDNYIRCCSQEFSCDVFPGRVTAFLTQQEKLPDVKYFICGKALMVVEVRDLLIEKGIPFENIMSEIYF